MMKAHDNVNTYAIGIVTEGETDLLFSDEKKDAELGCIGHLRIDFGHEGKEFWYFWFDHIADLKTQEFKYELDAVVNHLREDGNMFHSLRALSEYCCGHRDAKIPREFRDDNYGFKITTEAHSYYIRAMLTQGDNNIYCYCYTRERLELYLAAKQEKED